jgi:hypothetical protein
MILPAATLLKALDGSAMSTSSSHATNSGAIVVGEEGGPERLTRANLNSRTSSPHIMVSWLATTAQSSKP